MGNKISEIWDRIQEEKKNPELREKRLKEESREFQLDLNLWRLRRKKRIEEESRKLTLTMEWLFLNTEPMLMDNPCIEEKGIK